MNDDPIKMIKKILADIDLVESKLIEIGGDFDDEDVAVLTQHLANLNKLISLIEKEIKNE